MTTPDTPQRTHLAAGTVLGDRFEISDFLGAGSFGEVYRARQLLFGRGFRNVALKLFAEGVVTAQNAREILNDALLVFGLLDENPTLDIASHLVQVYDMGIVAAPAPRAFMSMRLIPGKKTLRSEVYRFRYAGGMPVSLSLRYLRELLAPLAWMHALETPAVHGDLKPENVMLTEDSRLVLVDFGLAARMPLGVRGGTIAYDAPEKLVGLMGGPAADVYSVGIIWYELLTGQHPFQNVGLEALGRGDSDGYTQAHIEARKWPICGKDNLPPGQWQKRIPPASEINQDLAGAHPQIELLLNKCLADDMSERFANARLLLDAIDAYIEKGGVLSQSDREVIGAAQKPRMAQAAPEMQPKTNEMRLGDAAALIRQEKPEQALAIADQILQTAPQSVAALLMRASALARISGRLKEADDACGMAMSLAPQDPAVYETLAAIREAQGKRTQAAGFRNTAGELRRKARPTGRTYSL
ncbi:MAG: serine/threonine protein kinase [Terracidiphilus sp.]